MVTPQHMLPYVYCLKKSTIVLEATIQLHVLIFSVHASLNLLYTGVLCCHSIVMHTKLLASTDCADNKMFSKVETILPTCMQTFNFLPECRIHHWEVQQIHSPLYWFQVLVYGNIVLHTATQYSQEQFPPEVTLYKNT